VPLGFAAFGPRLPAGDYPVKLIRGSDTLSTVVTLATDPRSTHTPADRTVQQETVLKLYRDLETLSYVVDAVVDVRDQARSRADKLGKDTLAKRLTGIADRLETLRKTLIATREGGQIAGEEQLREKLGSLYGSVNGYEGRPTNSQLRFVDVVEGKIADAQHELNEISGKELQALNTGLSGKKLEPLTAMTREDWQKKQPKN
jgi:hypothetical protein